MTSSTTVIDVADHKDIEKKPKSNSVAAWCYTVWRAVAAEFFAMFLLVVFGCMSCIPPPGYDDASYIFYSLGFGLTVMFNCQIFGHISGAHQNPAVTLAGIILGKTSITLGAAYFVAQILGSIAGYGTLVGLTNINLTDGICVSGPTADITAFQTLGIEIILTAALILVCCAFWDPVHESVKESSSPVVFGLTVVGLLLVGGPLSGAGINPAVSFGPSVWTGMWAMHWVYWLGPLSGGALGAIIYKVMFFNKPGIGH